MQNVIVNYQSVWLKFQLPDWIKAAVHDGTDDSDGDESHLHNVCADRDFGRESSTF